MGIEDGGYARAIEEAREELRRGVPAVMATSAGVEFRPDDESGRRGVFALPYLDRVLETSYPEGVVTTDGRPAVVAVVVVALHYLARSAGPLDLGDPVRFAGLPGATAYVGAFRSHSEVPLVRRFGDDGRSFVEALRRLGGVPSTPEADPEATWQVPLFPHLPVGVRLGLSDGAMPADCVITFPKRSGFVYHVEDLAVAGELLAARVLEVAEEAADAGPVATEGGDLARLATFFDPIEAELVVARLRSASIDAIVQPDALSVVYGITMDGHAKHHVLVRPEDLAEARGALDVEGEGGSEES